MPESCNGQDDDCDGTTDEGFDLQNDPRNCGRCGVVCAGGESCEAGRCLGAEPRVRLCGASAREPATFLRAEAAGFVYSADGCRLEGTQTLLVSRFGLDAFTRLVGVRAFLENGGVVVVGEYTTSATLTQAVFGVPRAPRRRRGRVRRRALVPAGVQPRRPALARPPAVSGGRHRVRACDRRRRAAGPGAPRRPLPTDRAARVHQRRARAPVARRGRLGRRAAASRTPGSM
jgi:hypothetical protein